MKRTITIFLAIAALVALAGCGQSKADKVAKNISTECENFNEECQRRIVGINAITDKVEFEVEGRCSIETGLVRSLEVTCKHGPDDFRKHYVGMADNVFFISTQLRPMDVSEYRTKVILKPENLVPDLDLVTGETP